MDVDLVSEVRRFNRMVVQRVGALDDHYLAQDRPLGEARLLWEIGEQGCDVRRLRGRLGLDSGYLSRLLRSLEAAGLVTVGPGEHDRRLRRARLTERGLAERAVLDQRSDDLAHSMLGSLAGDERERLVAAMGHVVRLLTAAQIAFDVTDPADADAQHCLHEYYGELDRRFGAGFDPSLSLLADLDGMRPPDGTFVVATLAGEPVACGAIRWRGGEPPELKRMWVAPAARGLGVGRRLLADLETRAAGRGHPVVRLETNQALTEAIAMYRSAGYREVDPFNDELYAHHWFEKRL
jgi:DNA-binding MarR family transcriptional regulator